jgi:hypothetical protein
MRGGARGGFTSYMPPRETLATASSRSNTEAQAVLVVLAHPHAAFHPCTCELHGGVTARIGYDDVEVAARMTTRRRWSWMTTSSTPICDCVGSLLQLFFRCSARLVVMIHDLLLTSIIVWHGRSSASVAYPFLYSGIKAVLHSSWSGPCAIVICDGY